MKRTQVASTHLASVGYDPAKHTLEIEFQNGRVYQYFNIPEEVYQALMAAESHGSYFNSYIREGGYAYRRVR